MLKAVIFDVDGTLVDSVPHHVRAWAQALRESGIDIPERDIHEGIGRSGHGLLTRLLTKDEMDRIGPKINQRAGKIFHEEGRQNVKPLGGVADLIRRIAATGRRIALASNSPRDELRYYMDLARIDGEVELTVSGEDVEHAKPAPDSFSCALRKLGLSPDQAIVIGDTPQDIEAATRSGIPAIGLDSGGFGPDRLREAGAVAVYQTVSELLEEFAESPLAAEGEARAR